MTITITCQYTGVQFEADSRRQKNHPLVSKFLNACANNKSNPSAYNMALGAFRMARESGMTDITKIIAFAERYISESWTVQLQRAIDHKNAQAAVDKAFEEKFQRAKAERKARNAILKQHGYTWSKESVDPWGDDDDETEWVLRSPDSRAIAPSQALDEIARGAEVVLAEIAAKEAAAETKRLERVAAERADAENRKAAIDLVRSLGHRVEPFDDTALPIIYEYVNYHTVTHIVRVRMGKIDGVTCGSTYEYWGGHDWNEQADFWKRQP